MKFIPEQGKWHQNISETKILFKLNAMNIFHRKHKNCTRIILAMDMELYLYIFFATFCCLDAFRIYSRNMSGI